MKDISLCLKSFGALSFGKNKQGAVLNCMKTDISLSGFLLTPLFNTAVVRIPLPHRAGKNHMPYELILNVNGHSSLNTSCN